MADTFDEIEARPWKEVMNLHRERLRDQLSYLSDNSKFYRRCFEDWDIDPNDIRTLDDLTNVPFTTKDDERRNQQQASPSQPLGCHQAAPTENLCTTLSSSGTTGTPTYFGLTEQDRDVWTTLVARAGYAMGVRPGDTVVDAIGRPIVPGGLPYIEGFRKIGANIVPAGGGSSEQLLTVLRDLAPDHFHSTPSHFEYLLERTRTLHGHGPDEFGVQTLMGGGEPGLTHSTFRERIKSGWDARGVRDVIGLGDVSGAIAAECEAENGAHFIAQGYVHPELIDPETGESKPFETGREGELVYTPLVREATPLLRFRSGDYARVLGTDCECGRTSPRFCIIGRSDDMLIYKGQNVYPVGIRNVISEISGVAPRIKILLESESQVHFTEPIPVRVGCATDSGRSDEEIRESIRSRVRKRLGVQVSPTLVPAEDIEVSPYKTDLVDVLAE